MADFFRTVARTINGFGFTLYGNSDHDPETRSYATTHYFVALFVPIFPIGRYRVINMGGNGYRFLGNSRSARPIAGTWHFDDGDSRPYPWWHDELKSELGLLPRTLHDSTRQAATSDYPAIPAADLKAQIDSGRSRMALLKTQLQPVIEELTSLDAQMETLKASSNHLMNNRKREFR